MLNRGRSWQRMLGSVLAALAVVLAVTLPVGSWWNTARASGDPVIMAAGDIACGVASTGSCYQASTDSAIQQYNPALVLPLGDEQYECGDLSDFQQYYNASWGQQKSITRPAVGNHEYSTSTNPSSPCYNRPTGAPGYYTYFGSAGSPLDPSCTVSCKGY